MSKFINSLEALKPISILALSTNFIFTLGSFWLLFSQYGELPPEIPLWFSKEWGLGRLANPIWLWVIPISALAILLFNNVFAVFLRKQTILALMLVWFASFFSFISLYSLYRLLGLAS